jgi:hypothetical protein
MCSDTKFLTLSHGRQELIPKSAEPTFVRAPELIGAYKEPDQLNVKSPEKRGYFKKRRTYTDKDGRRPPTSNCGNSGKMLHWKR